MVQNSRTLKIKLYLYFQVLLSIINMMAEDWMAFKSNIERAVMIKQAQTARLITVIGYFIVISATLVSVIPAFFGIQMMPGMNFTDQRKALPLITYHFYDSDRSPQFELTFCIHTISIFLVASVYMIIDIFLVLMIFHICGQLENFRCRLINLISCKSFNKTLNNIVASHLRMIRYTFLLQW
jgi:hypothetical protein